MECDDVCLYLCMYLSIDRSTYPSIHSRPLRARCLTRAFTGSGAQKWVVQVFVDGTVEVTLNNEIIQTRESVTGLLAVFIIC